MATLENVIGEVEILSQTDPVKVGDTVRLIFRAEDVDPPFNLKVRSPVGKVILERVLRELPTGKPQSAPAAAFTAIASGAYKIEIVQLYGKMRGDATLNVP